MKTTKEIKTIEDALETLKAVSKQIQKESGYPCGLEEDTREDNGIIRGFFSSPDYQNERLFYALRSLGFIRRHYQAYYHWAVRTTKRGDDDIVIDYTEGDISIYTIGTLKKRKEERERTVNNG